jgi:hypothetical protein
MSKKILHLGSKGEAVVAVQRELQNRVASGLVINGIFDKGTEAAVRLFQQKAGFTGKDIDGKVGPKTMLAIFQTFEMHLTIPLVPQLKRPDILDLKLPTYSPSSTSSPSQAKPAEPPPKLRQLTLQAGPQWSRRDGTGPQLQFGVTFRAGKPYFPHSDKHKFYHGAHAEVIPQATFGIPVAKGGIFTGQATVTVQPLTDWLVIGDKWHLFTPAFGFYHQWPFNSGPSSDPSTHFRIGGYAGVELFHFDILPDKLSVGVSGQEALYWDSTNKRFYGDPSVMASIQGSLFSW